MTDTDAAVAEARRYIGAYENHGLSEPGDKAMRFARALVALASLAPSPSPIAGYDQPGKSHYCLDCDKHWFGHVAPCTDRRCPFRQDRRQP